ncbi:polysaccharide lyase [Streptomyces sp. M19]
MRRRQFIAAGAAGAAAAMAAVLTSCSGGGSDDDDSTPSPSADTSLDWDTPPWPGSSATGSPRDEGSFGLSRAELREEPHPVLGRLLRVRYPARSASPTVARRWDRPVGGAQLYLALRSGPTDALHLRYYLRFANDFDFVKGGKLPGLYGGRVTGGRHIPNGENGLSTRYMWRSGGRGEVYAYLPTSIAHGTSLGRGDWQWPVGRWTCVEQAVTLNTPARPTARWRCCSTASRCCATTRWSSAPRAPADRGRVLLDLLRRQRPELGHAARLLRRLRGVRRLGRTHRATGGELNGDAAHRG